MVANLEATIEDLYALPHEQKAEIVNGEIVLMSPSGAAPSYAAAEIVSSLSEYSRRKRNGHAVSSNAAFIVNLSSRKSFSPDAAFCCAKRAVWASNGTTTRSLKSSYCSRNNRDNANPRAS